jgi:hypothetical protein
MVNMLCTVSAMFKLNFCFLTVYCNYFWQKISENGNVWSCKTLFIAKLFMLIEKSLQIKS